MTRREAIQRLALAFGGTLSLPVLGAALSCRHPSTRPAAWAPRTLTAPQLGLVTALAEAVLPATDTPGATGAGVHEFADHLLTDWMSEDERERFLGGLGALDAACRERFAASFPELDAERQLDFLRPLDAAGVEARRAGEDPLPFFATLKEVVLVGYYTSEIGMTQELQYRVVFPSYEGCVPLDEVGRAWASNSDRRR